jgi:molybdopterin converting factor small subunit
MIKIKVLGNIKSILGKSYLIIYKEEINIKELLEIIEQSLKSVSLNNMLILINGVEISVFEGGKSVIKPEDEVIIIPALHGGSFV